MPLKGNLIIGQSGGPTVVINQSLVGVILEACKHTEIKNIYGMRNGVAGLLKEHIVDLKKESKKHLEIIAHTPSSALGSCRHKPSEEECVKIFEICKKHNIRYFFYIGGNDSAETSHIINTIAKRENYEFRVFHLPKTIDNDLLMNDHTPGFGSAAKYVASYFMGDNLDNLALPGIKINIVMGRHAGFLTAAAALGRQDESDGPHLVYVPELPVSLDDMTEAIARVYEKQGRALVSVSEGIKNIDGKVMLESKISEQDAHGNIQLSGSGALGDFLSEEIKNRLNTKLNKKLRVRADTLGYGQRHFPGVYSVTDAKEAREVGKWAVKYAVKGDIDGSITLNRKKKGYTIEYGLTELKNVAKVTREMPREFMNTEGNFITKKFIDYAKPIMGPLPLVGKLKYHLIKK